MRNKTLPICLASLAVWCYAADNARADWPKIWPNSQPKVKESPYQTPAKMAVIWSPAVFNQVGKQSTRGFGGRIYFYDQKNDAIAVEGQLVVYVYNDSTPGGENKVPEKKFAFTPEQFTKHYTPTQLGASYSVWVPWDAVGSPQVQLTLIPIFTSSGGQLVIGEASHNMLPGPTAPTGELQYGHALLPPSPVVRPDPNLVTNAGQASAAPAAANNFGIQQASFQPQEAPMALPQQPTGPAMTTINLPGTLSDRLTNAPPQLVGPMEKLAQQRATLTASRLAAANAAAASAISNAPAGTTALRPAAGAAPQAVIPSVPPPVRYGPPSPQAPISPVPQPAPGPLPSALFPAGQPSVLPSQR